MPTDSLPPLEEFLSGGTQYIGPPEAGDLAALPTRDRRTPGTVVGRAHTVPPTVLNIVNEQGQGFPVDLAQLTPDRVNRAAQPHAAFGSAEDAAVATFHRLAGTQQRAAAPRNPAYTGVVVQDARARTRARPMGQPEPLPANPEAAVAPPRAVQGPGYVEQGARQTRPNLMTGMPLSNQVEAPRQQVTYEIPGYGPLDTFYHQVIRTGAHLVLVFDKRHVGQRGFPRHSEAQLGMRVHGTDRLFMVTTTGIEFDLDAKALCLLEIVEEGSYSEYQAQHDPLQQALGRIPFPEPTDGEDRSHFPGGDPAGADEFHTGHDANPGF